MRFRQTGMAGSKCAFIGIEKGKRMETIRAGFVFHSLGRERVGEPWQFRAWAKKSLLISWKAIRTGLLSLGASITRSVCLLTRFRRTITLLGSRVTVLKVAEVLMKLLLRTKRAQSWCASTL